MYVLYLDDAGSVVNRQDRHFVLAGIAVFERQVHWLQDELERLAAGLGHPDPGNLELHANQIFAGRGWWRSMRSRDERRAVIKQGLAVARSLHPLQWRLFGVAIDRQALSPEDPVEYAFEQLCNRFDRFLNRLHHQGDRQKGLIVLDESAQETRLQSLATEFRTLGHRWGVTRHLVDVPLFVDSRATRCLQYADLVAYALWRKYEMDDGEFFDVISDRFDREGATVHGLHHYRNLNYPCDCPGCAAH